jgi:hypothetical protein
MKKTFLLFFLIFFCNFSLVYSDQKVAPSKCNLFINKIIDDYDLIKNHTIANFVDPKIRIYFEQSWDPKIEVKDEYNNNKISYGETIYKRDKENNIIIGNISPQYKKYIKAEIGNKIFKINDLETRSYSDEDLDNIFFDSDKKKEVKIEYVDSNGLKKKDILLFIEQDSKIKYLDFKIDSFNNISNQTFISELLVKYQIQSEIWDGETVETKDDAIYKMAHEIFYNKDEDDEWFDECSYTDDEINQMQLYSPGWDVNLMNSAYKDKNTSEVNTNIKLYQKDVNFDYDSIDVQSNFVGLIKTNNQFDLKSFPFDKQKIIFSFRENFNTEVTFEPSWAIYASLYDLTNKEQVVNGWKLKNYSVQGFNINESTDYADVYTNGINIILDVERESQYYIYKVILPIILILMVCWSAIWITPLEIESRLTITIVCLLSLIAYNFVIDSELPKLEYLTIMDWIIFVSYIFAAIPNFLCIIGFNLYKSNKKLCKKIDNYSKFIGPISYLIIVLSIMTITVNTQPDTSSQLLKAIAGK